jgi:hypothetical protein
MTGDPLPDEALSSIREALYEGQKIQAVKLHREATGSSLREAKNAIEALELELRATTPERFLAKPSSPGCLGAIALTATMTIFAIWSAAH